MDSYPGFIESLLFNEKFVANKELAGISANVAVIKWIFYAYIALTLLGFFVAGRICQNLFGDPGGTSAATGHHDLQDKIPANSPILWPQFSKLLSNMGKSFMGMFLASATLMAVTSLYVMRREISDFCRTAMLAHPMVVVLCHVSVCISDLRKSLIYFRVLAQNRHLVFVGNLRMKEGNQEPLDNSPGKGNNSAASAIENARAMIREEYEKEVQYMFTTKPVVWTLIISSTLLFMGSGFYTLYLESGSAGCDVRSGSGSDVECFWQRVAETLIKLLALALPAGTALFMFYTAQMFEFNLVPLHAFYSSSDKNNFRLCVKKGHERQAKEWRKRLADSGEVPELQFSYFVHESVVSQPDVRKITLESVLTKVEGAREYLQDIFATSLISKIPSLEHYYIVRYPLLPLQVSPWSGRVAGSSCGQGR